MCLFWDANIHKKIGLENFVIQKMGVEFFRFSIIQIFCVLLQINFFRVQQQDSIRQNLDKFIRKYYKNRMIKGVIYTLALLLSLFLIITILEHFGYFGTVVRAVFFWCYLLVGVAVLTL